ncbi:MAG: hypothetical protein PVI86_09430 [Phycisphaerae bacterium]
MVGRMTGTVAERRFWLRHAGVVVVLLSLLPLTSCVAPRKAPAKKQQAHQAPATLRARAQTLWEARVNEDWETAFLFEDPRMREGVEPAEFVEWAKNNEPFIIHAFELGDDITDGDFGWVEVDCRTSIRRFPGAQHRDVHRWEKWRRVDGAWYPVPRGLLDNYPLSPAVRDAAQEARLHARFQEAWSAREQEDWAKLYALTDPEDRREVPEDGFAETHSLVEFLSSEVLWVQAVGGEGTLRVGYRYRTTDPNLSKLPPQLKYLNEKWIKRHGEWYLDISSE